MEAEWMAKRTQLRDLLQTRPDLTLKEKASYLGCSYGWAKKWKRRLAQAPSEDQESVRSQSRRNHVMPYPWDPLVERRIEQMRLVPPKGLRRIPGPVALLAFFPDDQELIAKGCRLPKSSRTVWKILDRLGLITRAPKPRHEPLPLAAPLEEVQMDFQDATTVERDWGVEGKLQHLVEVLNFVDRGTSILLQAQAREDFHAATALEAVIDFLRTHGRPQRLSFDHDPRWVGGSSGWDFPSALIRFLWGVGVEVRITPVHQPWHNAFVERYHRSYKEECLHVDFPRTLEEVRRVTANYQGHYNDERPHQGRACRNRPPRVVFPELPTLPALPTTVQADAWLYRIHEKVIQRVVGSDGAVQVNHEEYFLGKAFAGRIVALQVDAARGTLNLVEPMGEKAFPIKHLVRGSLSLEGFIAQSLEQALSEERMRLALKAQFRKGERDPTP